MAVWIGLLTGFIICIPLGPINVFVIQTQIKKSTKRALAIAMGGSVMDFLYFYIILTGLSFFQFPEEFVTSFKIIGVLAIFGMGLKEFFKKHTTLSFGNKKETPIKLFAAFMFGVAIYTSNPTLIVTMTGLGAFFKSTSFFPMTSSNILLFSLSVGVGGFLWFYALTQLVKKYREKIQNEYMAYFSKISGGLMILLSILMGIKFFQ